MKKASDILKDLGFKTESAPTTQQAFVSRLSKVARDGSPSKTQEIQIRDFEATFPPKSETETAKKTVTSTEKSRDQEQRGINGLVHAQGARKSRQRSKSKVSEDQLAFDFEAFKFKKY